MADWLCGSPSSSPQAGVRVSIPAGEPMTDLTTATALTDLVSMIATMADVEKSSVSLVVTALDASSTLINVTVGVPGETVELAMNIAETLADELRATVGTLGGTVGDLSARLAFSVMATPTIDVLGLAAVQSATGTSPPPSPTAIEVQPSPFPSPFPSPLPSPLPLPVAEVRETSMGGDGGAAQSLIEASSANASSHANATDHTADDADYYKRMRSLASLHLVWVLPLILFLLCTCGVMWIAANTGTVNMERHPDSVQKVQTPAQRAPPRYDDESDSEYGYDES